MLLLLRTQSLAYFFMENGQPYKKGFTLLPLCCLCLDEANYMLREIHEGIYGIHLTGSTIALKAIHLGYYWLRMKLDTLKLV